MLPVSKPTEACGAGRGPPRSGVLDAAGCDTAGVAMTDLQADVRLWIYEQVVAEGLAPGPLAIGRRFDLHPTEVERTLRTLQEHHDALVLLPGTSLIWMAEPFSAVPTSFRVRSGPDAWWGNCIWDALAVLALLDRDGTVETRCPGSGTDLTLTVAEGELVPADHVVHFAVAARDWWRSIGFT